MKTKNEILAEIKFDLIKKHNIDILDDGLINDCVEMTLKAINYSQCSTQLKDKYGKDFEYFVKNKVNVQNVGNIYWFKDVGYTDLEELHKKWLKITKPLIV